MVAFLCISTFVPGGTSGVLLKSNALLRRASVNLLGLMHDVCKRLSVSTACGSNQSHRCIGKSWLVLQRPAMK